MAELPRRLAPLAGIVVLSLEDVPRITSFGIRDWLRALASMEASYVAFARCRPAILRQFNMIRGFGRGGELISFFVPSLCTKCDQYFECLVDLRVQSVSRIEDLTIDPCSACGGEGEFDEFDDYLEYPSICAAPNPPYRAQLLIDEERHQRPEKLILSKRVDGNITYLSLFGALVEHSKLRRWVDGLEGEVHVDLVGLKEVSTSGLQDLTALLTGPETIRSLLRGVRLDLCDRIIPMIGEHIKIASVIARGTCMACRASVEVVVGVDGVPELATCHHCFTTNSITLRPEIAERAAAATTARLPKSGNKRRRRVTKRHGLRIVAESPGFKRVVDLATEVAQSDATVLIRGETGTGKELIARLIHAESPRSERPFIAVNSSAFPTGLIESELFGHESGAFTGASGQRIGRFELANTGTLFLDEVGDLPAGVQVKLLRTLQERYVERVGGNAAIPIDIRLIAATHRDIEQMVRDGTFRRDLYYRLNVVPLSIPPLRERREDLFELADFYLARFQRRAGKTGIRLSDKTRSTLLAHSWPGNVRELLNVVERVVALTNSNQVIEIDELGTGPVVGQAGANDQNLKEAVEHFERELIVRALAAADGNRSETARQLGMSRQALRHKLVKYGLG
jgi:DNA-binding NtrC family response regulator